MKEDIKDLWIAYEHGDKKCCTEGVQPLNESERISNMDTSAMSTESYAVGIHRIQAAFSEEKKHLREQTDDLRNEINKQRINWRKKFKTVSEGDNAMRWAYEDLGMSIDKIKGYVDNLDERLTKLDTDTLTQMNALSSQLNSLSNQINQVISLNRPVDGQWNTWSEWTQCAVTCDKGTISRHRACTNPAPSNGGLNCYGDASEVEECFTDIPCFVFKNQHCYFEGNSTGYSGTLASTYKGKTCQRWDSQYPNEHEYTKASQYPDGSLTAAANYCRDPSDSGYTWCYIADSYKEWGVCDVTRCETVFKNQHCYYGVNASWYSGTLASTIKGKTCQRWDSQYPHENGYTKASQYPDGSLTAAANYCRDPSDSGYTWCYTTDPDDRWDVCNVTKCKTEWSAYSCYHFNENASDYDGHLSVTVNGRRCQRWDLQFPHKHGYKNSEYHGSSFYSNYCRDPEGWGLPWCYTEDPDHRWEVCDIARCVSS
ncbi:hypothetical protein ACF0H5_002488 [Mactra antiquata]